MRCGNKAVKHLYGAMWENGLEEKLLYVDECKGLKYLPATEIKNLQLQELGCDEDTILFRKEYTFTSEKLEGLRPNIRVVMTGQPGIGTSSLKKCLGGPPCSRTS